MTEVERETVSELEHLKSEVISKPVVGGNDEKNITKSDDISAVNEPSKSLRPFFVRKKSMDQAGKNRYNYTGSHIIKVLLYLRNQ